MRRTPGQMLRDGWPLLPHGGRQRAMRGPLARSRSRFGSTCSQTGAGKAERDSIMAEQARTLQTTSQAQIQSRAGQVRLGVWIELASFLWMIVEASIAITTGYLTHS